LSTLVDERHPDDARELLLANAYFRRGDCLYSCGY